MAGKYINVSIEYNSHYNEEFMHHKCLIFTTNNLKRTLLAETH